MSLCNILSSILVCSDRGRCTTLAYALAHHWGIPFTCWCLPYYLVLSEAGTKLSDRLSECPGEPLAASTSMSSIYLKLQGFVNLEILESGFVLPFFGIGKPETFFQNNFRGSWIWGISAFICYNIPCFCSVLVVFGACALQAEQAVARPIDKGNSPASNLISN
jgi:hypothetical protein